MYRPLVRTRSKADRTDSPQSRICAPGSARGMGSRCMGILPVVHGIALVKRECVLHPCTKRRLRLPTELRLDLGVVPVVITDVDDLAFGRKWYQLIRSLPVYLDEKLGRVLQTDRVAGPEVEDCAIGLICRSDQEQGVDHVLNIVEISNLLSIPIHQDGLALDEPANPDSKKRLTGIFDPHPWTIGVGQSKHRGSNPIHPAIE